MVLLAGIMGCKTEQQKALDKYFPDCEHGVIGSTSGASCKFDSASREWRISLWNNGSGDCPAGCINRDYYAWFVVDAKGSVFFASDQSFSRRMRIDRQQLAKFGPLTAPASAPPPPPTTLSPPRPKP